MPVCMISCESIAEFWGRMEVRKESLGYTQEEWEKGELVVIFVPGEGLEPLLASCAYNASCTNDGYIRNK